MKTLLAASLLAAGLIISAAEAAPLEMTMYKNPQCECCTGHAAYLEQNGFKVKVVPTEDLEQIKHVAGIPENLEGCHTIMVGGYVVEGHVPAGPIKKLLAEKPKVKGVALAGMPMGSPGMGGTKIGSFTIYAFGDGKVSVFAIE